MTEKKVCIKLLGEAKEEYLKLRDLAVQEEQKGIANSFHQTLLKSIDSKIAILKVSYDHGIQIPRRLIPSKYAREYEVTNLWKVNLSGYWRLIYTLKQPQRNETDVEIISIWLDVLDLVDHQKYNEIFGYKKR